MFHFMSILCLSMTSLITCSQDICPVPIISYSLVDDDGGNHVRGHAIFGHSYKNITVDDVTQCYEKCAYDCRCLSIQVSGNRCELVDENRQTTPHCFQPAPGYLFIELKQEFCDQVNIKYSFFL